MKKKHTRHWIRLGARFFYTYLTESEKPSEIISSSYDIIAHEYDKTWTNSMQHPVEEMIVRLSPETGAQALDLACGTGFVTAKLAKLVGRRVIGVDASKGMINVAKDKYYKYCDFVQSDMMEYLHRQSSKNLDIVTCAWGLGYSHPFYLFREISRVLQPGGHVGIIDLSKFSNWKMYWLSLKILAEKPESIEHKINVHYLTNCSALKWQMQLNGIQVLDAWDGFKTFYLNNAEDVKEQLKNTGSVVVFESIIKVNYKEWFYNRLAEVIQKQYGRNKIIPIVNHYIAAIGKKR
ncbi:methyltransferase domain-containing protein [bacterium]|nr:methyltransferase domain-containing protein [bacterium]